MWLCDSISYMSLKEEGIFVVSALARSEVGRSNPAVRWGSDLMKKGEEKKETQLEIWRRELDQESILAATAMT